MIVCPNPDCIAEEFESFEVETRYGMFGSGAWVNCADCGHSFEVEVLVLEPRPGLFALPATAPAV